MSNEKREMRNGNGQRERPTGNAKFETGDGKPETRNAKRETRNANGKSKMLMYFSATVNFITTYLAFFRLPVL